MSESKTVADLATMTVNETILRRPESVAVFQRHGIDACCGGGLPLEEAARRHGIALADLLAEIEETG